MIEIILYCISALFCLFIGIQFTIPSIQGKALKCFFAFVLLYPSTTFLNDIFLKSQVTVFHFFFIPSLVIFVANILSYRKIPSQYFLIILSSISIVLFLTTYSILNQDTIRLEDYFKDIKIFLTLSLGVSFAYCLRQQYLEGFLDQRFISKIIKYNFFVDSAIFLSLFALDFRFSLSGDPSFLIKEVRYGDLGTFFLVFILLYRIILEKKASIWQWIYTILPILYVGNRTIIAGIILVFLLRLFFNLTRRKALLLGFGLSLLPVLVFLLSIADFPVFEKFNNISSYEKLILAFQNRFSPFFVEIRDFKVYEHLFGRGIGFSFFIPWFTYRPEIDDFNVYIDNIYLTLYAKYGLLFSLTVLAVFSLYLRRITIGSFFFYYVVFFIIQGITTAFLYQHHIIFAITFPLLILKEDSSLKNKTSFDTL